MNLKQLKFSIQYFFLSFMGSLLLGIIIAIPFIIICFYVLPSIGVAATKESFLAVLMVYLFLTAIISHSKKNEGKLLLADQLRSYSFLVSIPEKQFPKSYIIYDKPDLIFHSNQTSEIEFSLWNDGNLTITIPTIIKDHFCINELDSFEEGYKANGIIGEASDTDIFNSRYKSKPELSPTAFNVVLKIAKIIRFNNLTIKESKIIIQTNFGIKFFESKQHKEILKMLKELSDQFDVQQQYLVNAKTEI